MPEPNALHGPSRQSPRLAGSVHLEHPTGVERMNGARSRATLALDRGLKSGALDIVELSEDDLLRLIESAVGALRVMREGR